MTEMFSKSLEYQHDVVNVQSVAPELVRSVTNRQASPGRRVETAGIRIEEVR